MLKGWISSSGARGGLENVSDGPAKHVARSESIRIAFDPSALPPPTAKYSYEATRN
jgi:hypothetical protein